MTWQEVFLLPLDGMLVQRRVSTPSIKFAGTHLNTWEKRGTMREKGFSQEHNTVPHQSTNPDRSIQSLAH